MPISSPNNELLKEVRKLTGRRWRDKLSRFVAEGEDLVDAAEAAGWPPVAKLVAAGSGLDGEEVVPHLLAEHSQLGSGTRVIGLFDQRFASSLGERCVALWGVGDPGNVGTVLRAAHAFGASAVALGPGSADPFSPKAVRASMGAIFSVGVRRVRAVDELPMPRVALVARSGDELSTIGAAATLIVGAERDGLPEEVLRGCQQTAHIPIAGDSLNAAMAATVALYETNRVGRSA
ncbi:MAG: RNA methyltransferase [Solirubrobacteraceae bacterium]